jgi:uncharacterized protein YqgC (DUF456 family)
MDPAIYQVIAAILVAIGLVGVVVPVIPGAIFIFAGIFLSAQADAFRHAGWITLTIVGVLGLLTFAADLAGSVLGAKRVGASPLALAGAAIGGIVGFFFGIAGIIAGPFVGATLGELVARGRPLQAGKVGLGTWLGLVAAAIAKVVLAVTMIAVYAFAWLI